MPSTFGVPVTTANRYGVVAAAQSMTLVSTLTASNSTSLIYTGLSSASYAQYVFEFLGIVPSGGGQLNMQLSTDGGATYGTYFCYDSWGNNGSTTWVNRGSAAYNAFTATVGMGYSNTNNGGQISGSMKLNYPANSSLYPILQWMCSGGATNDRNYFQTGGAIYNASGVNAIKFLGSTMTTGIIKIYGIT